MKYAFLAAALFTLGGLALAQEPPTESADRLREFQRDRSLIELVVQEGVRLAGEDDPLKRARSCNVVAERLAAEIKTAAVQRDQQRAAKFGTFLQAVLIRGVANNLDTARSRLDDDAEPDPDFQRIRDDVLRFTEPVTGGDTQKSEQQIMQPAAKAINAGRSAVEDAVKGKKAGP
jgi:hypothetical protein